MTGSEKAGLSIVIPVYREAPNIAILIKALGRHLDPVLPGWEVIMVDDDSQDGTAAICEKLRAQGAPLHLVIRKNKRGLATAVLEGFTRAQAPVIVVMDGDLSHQPAAVPAFYQAVQDGAEFVLGSRYIAGGSTDDRWTVYRFLNSHVASILARPLIAVSDPMSGFFAFPRRLLERCPHLSPVGYKIGLEIMVRCRPRPVKEVPIFFRSRRLGRSKLTLKQQLLYLQHLGRLYRYKWKLRY